MTTVSQLVNEIIKLAGLTARDLARITGASERTAQRWISGEITPYGERKELILNVLAIVRALSKGRKPEQVWEWLHTPHPVFGHDAPIDHVKSDPKRVLATVSK